MDQPKTPRLLARFTRGALRHGMRIVTHGVVGGLLALLIVGVVVLEKRPDLQVWHEADLDEEFTADSEVASFADYLELEDRLFEQLEKQVYDEVPADQRHSLNRYSRDSRADPSRWPRNWNRSYELSSDTAVAGALLLHGLSDSPYSMRTLAERLHAEGLHVLVLRVPGHGTAPVGLVDVDWEDMAAAVQIGVRHLRDEVADAPLYAVGYSNGGALAVQYALSALEDDTLPSLDGLVLLSPEIGISRLAALATWQEWLGHLLGLGKLSWSSILLEYDPFKYGSFAINGGKLAHELTIEIQNRIGRVAAAGGLDRFPPLIAFQSIVDATVTAPALVKNLFERLPAGEHELVLFDVNRTAQISSLLNHNPTAWVDSMLENRKLLFGLTAITNEGPHSERVVVRHRAPGARVATSTPLDLRWPKDVYSLSHVALPFPPDDPVYGGPNAAESPGIQLGNVALRGERGALLISASDQLRLRWNPFHSYLLDRTVEFVLRSRTLEDRAAR
ncbi:MAG: alpha/beta fold hydrolase [Deltaproteobacteria bacterium]|nr:alpha/beta fold hydrolase [Deltaproteobacteria bacterium]